MQPSIRQAIRHPMSTSRSASASHRQRLVPTRTMTTPITTAQATCTDGIADSCAGPDFPNDGYTVWPNNVGVSSTCSDGTKRGGATGISWIARHHRVLSAMTLRTGGYWSRWRNHNHGKKISIDGMCTLA